MLLRELAHVPNDQVTIMIATGTHRPNTHEELDEMLGPDIAGSYRVVNHSAFDSEIVGVRGRIVEWYSRLAEQDVAGG